MAIKNPTARSTWNFSFWWAITGSNWFRSEHILKEQSDAQNVVSRGCRRLYDRREKREKSYEERILRDIQNGIIIETLMAKKHKKTPEEKAAVAKQKKQQRRARRKQETRDNLAKEEILQDDRFFVIAGYTSGGAPYGVTWEEMGLKPWEDLEENN